MKKSFLMLAVAGMVMASCAQQETVEVADSRAIGFDNFVGKPTKAVINSAADLKSFNVFGGYSSLTNNFNNVEVTKSGDSWTYTGTQYWEATKTYTFQAYAGAKSTETFTVAPSENGVNFTKFVADGATDLLSADVVKVTTDGESQPQTGTGVLADGKVQFDFRHVLSMIKFTFTSTLASNVNITISNLKVNQLNNTGDYAAAGGNTGTWTSSNPTDYTLTTADAFAAPATKESSEIIVIPQKIAKNTIAVTFTLNATGGLTIVDKTHTVYLPATTWEEGKRYNYTAELTADNIDPEKPLKPIVFDTPKVDAWPEYSGAGNVEKK